MRRRFEKDRDASLVFLGHVAQYHFDVLPVQH